MMQGIRTCLAALMLLVSAASGAVAQEERRIVVVHQALQEITERLVGEGTEVVFPVPAGVDPSFWRPTIADISLVQSADLILLNGAGFASWIDRVSLPRARLVNTTAGLEDQFIVTQSITHSHGDGGEHSHEGLASYTWLDPRLAMAQAEAVAAALIARGLAPEAAVTGRLEALRGDLAGLEVEAVAALGDAQGVAMIATHPRYDYFARRFDVSISALDWEAGAMPDDDQLAELAQRAAQQQARILIWEADPGAQAFAATEALGLRNVVFDPHAGRRDGRAGFMEAYAMAVADLSDAIGALSN